MTQASEALAALLPDIEQKFLRYCVADAAGSTLLNLAGFKYLLKSCPGLEVHDDRVPVFFAAGAGIGEGEAIPRTLRLTFDSFLVSLKRIAAEKYGSNDTEQTFLKLVLECMLPHRLEDPTFAAFLRGSTALSPLVGVPQRPAGGAGSSNASYSSGSPTLRAPPTVQAVGGTPARPSSSGPPSTTTHGGSSTMSPPRAPPPGHAQAQGHQAQGQAQSSTAAAAAGMVMAHMEQMARAGGAPVPSSSSQVPGGTGTGTGMGVGASSRQQPSRTASSPAGGAGVGAGSSIGSYARAAALASAGGSPISNGTHYSTSSTTGTGTSAGQEGGGGAAGRAVLVGSVSPAGLLSLPVSTPPDPRTGRVTVQLLQHPVSYTPTGGGAALHGSPSSASASASLAAAFASEGGLHMGLPAFLSSLRLQPFLHGMAEFGIERVEDLLDVSEQDLSSLGMKPLHRRKLREALLLYVQALTSHPPQTFTSPPPAQHHQQQQGGHRGSPYAQGGLGMGAVAPWYSPSNAGRIGGGGGGGGVAQRTSFGPEPGTAASSGEQGGSSWDSRASVDSGSPPTLPSTHPSGRRAAGGTHSPTIPGGGGGPERPQRSFVPPPMDPPRPTSLPHWEEYANAEGYLYYHCPVTGVTQWSRPSAGEGTVRTIAERKAAQAAKTAAVQQKVASALQSVLGLGGRGGDGLREITGVTGVVTGGGEGEGEGQRRPTRRPSAVSAAGRRNSAVGGGTAEERLSAAQGLPLGPAVQQGAHASAHAGGYGGGGDVPLLRTYSASSIHTANAGEGIQPGSLELLKALLDQVAASKGLGGGVQADLSRRAPGPAQGQAQGQGQGQGQRMSRADSPSGRSMGGASSASTANFAAQFLGVSGLLPADPGPLAISQVMKSNSTVGRASVLARHRAAAGGTGRGRPVVSMPGSPTRAGVSSPPDSSEPEQGPAADRGGAMGEGRDTGSASGSATEAFMINTERQGGGLSVAPGEGGLLALERQWSSGVSVGGSVAGGMGGMGGAGTTNGYMKGAMTPSLFVRQHQAQKEAIARNVAAEVRTLAAAESAVDIYPEVYADMPSMDEATFDHYVRSHALANPRKMGYADPRPDIRPAVRLGSVNADLSVGRVEFSNTGKGLDGRATAMFAGQLRQNLYTTKADPNTPRTAGEMIDKSWGGGAVAPSATASGYAYRHAAALSAWTGQGSVYDRLTDHRGFTGMHRQRFDGEGRGKGLAGRDGTYDMAAVRATIPDTAAQGAPYLVDNRLAAYAPPRE